MPDPYGVWVSEAMLQPTRVETAIEYWKRFLGALPTVRDLAAASEERVLALWSGLGYYRRARSLQAAAEVVVEVHGGQVPRTRAELLALPGVGPYTAGAVLSIAFDLPEPLVDGNVTRVLSRLFAIRGETSRAAVQRELWSTAAWLVPVGPAPDGSGGGAGDWNQALMELGATVCSPQKPACAACPVAAVCRARLEGLVEQLPELPRRPAPIEVELVAILAQRRGELLLEQRPPTGRMASMWQLPTAERPAPVPAAPVRQAQEPATSGLSGLFPPDLPGGLVAGEALGTDRHSITRHRIRLTVCAPERGCLPERGRAAELRWFGRAELAELPLTGMARKVLRAAFARGGGAGRTRKAGPR